MTFKEALVDTLRFYSEDTSRRSKHGSDCIYVQRDGHRCAVGRLIKDGMEKLFVLFDGILHGNNIEAVVHAHQARAFGEGRNITETEAIAELTVLSDATLSDLLFLQVIHDEDPNWDESGLTEFGEGTVRAFRPDIAEEVLAAVGVEVA